MRYDSVLKEVSPEMTRVVKETETIARRLSTCAVALESMEAKTSGPSD